MKTLRDYINLVNEATINVQGIQQAAKVKAYQDAIAAGKSEEEAQNAEAAAGNLAGAEALSRVDINDPSTYVNAPRPETGPRSEAERQQWIQDPTQTARAAPVAQPAPVAAQPVAPKQWNKGVLGMGSQGPEVEALQKRLGIAPDGKYGPATRDAVIALQKKLGVTADGAYGPATRAAHDRSGSGAQPATTAPQSGNVQSSIRQVQNNASQIAASNELASGRIGPAEAQAVLDNGSQRDIDALGGRATLQQIANSQPQTATTPPATAATTTTIPANQTAGGAVTARPVRPATGARATAIQQQQAQNQTPESIMSKSDAQLLEKMLTIANLK